MIVGVKYVDVSISSHCQVLVLSVNVSVVIHEAVVVNVVQSALFNMSRTLARSVIARSEKSSRPNQMNIRFRS